MRCIQCANHRASRSRRRTPWDWFLSAWGVYPFRCGACGTRFHARHRKADGDSVEPLAEMTKAPEAFAPEVKPVRRRKRKGWFRRLEELTDIRREKKIRIATQVAIYGLALLTFLALVYVLVYYFGL